MPNRIFKEEFTAGYDGVIPPTLLQPGWLSGGLNVRLVSEKGGWKPRKGCSTHNTTGIDSTTAGKSLHQYENPRSSDYYFIGQCNSKLYKSPQSPPTAAAGTAWTDLGSGASRTFGTTPGFSCMVGEYFFYADGSTRPAAFGGSTPYPIAVLAYDASEDHYLDITRRVVDKRSDTEGLILGAATDTLIVITQEIAEGITLDLGSTVNTNAVTITLKSWQSSAWSDRSATDGTLDTATSTKCLNKDGSITWARSANDKMKFVAGYLGYAYQISWSGALSNSVDLVAVTVTQDLDLMTNKWDGVMSWVTGCRFYDQSAGEYKQFLGHVTNESTSQYLDASEMTSSDFIYIGVPEPACAFGIGVAPGYENSADAQIAASGDLQYWDGDSWVDVAAFDDQTLDGGADSSFAHTAFLSFDASVITTYKRTLEGEPFPMYWYRIAVDATLSANTRIYMISYAAFPETLPDVDGVVEFKGRLTYWGDPEFPNRLRFSSSRSPFCFSGSDSGYSKPFGDLKPILYAARFYNELIVWKEDSVWLLEGDSLPTFGILKIADTVGLASPKSAVVVEVGYPSAHRDEPLSVAIWQDVDGIYILDGRKPRKVSLPMDHYFNVEYSTAIEATKIRSCQAFPDRLNNEYHFLISYSATQDHFELVYNYAFDMWYPPWYRNTGGDNNYLVSGLCFKGSDDRWYTYAVNDAGKVFRLETDTTDKDNSNADVAISHSIKSRAISADPKMATTFWFTLRQLWAELKSRAAGTLTVNTFKNIATSGTSQDTPSAMSMVNSGYNLATPELNLSEEDCVCFQIEFALATADQEMEIYSMLYELGIRGPIEGT